MDPTGLITGLETAIPAAVPYITAAVTIMTIVVRIAPPPAATAPIWWKDLYAAIHLIANFKQPPAPPVEGTPK